MDAHPTTGASRPARRRTRVTWWAAMALTAAVAGCGGGPPTVAVLANTQSTLTPGPNRLVMALASQQDGSFVDLPDTAATATFSDENGASIDVPASWVWGIPDVRGFFIADVDLPDAGRWSVVLRPEGRSATPPTPFVVQPDSQVPSVGDAAIPSATPTYPDTPLESLTSDPDPDPRLYSMSLDDALSDGRPTVVTFATPAYCTSALCGPTLDVVRSVLPDFPDVDFVHVEVYDLAKAAAGTLDAVPAVVAWGLPSEPWVFVVDGDGIITARFEGVIGADELRGAVSGLS